eukprot:CAMPEP_0177522654 /NCGR_PEP_ID=MMETSP0369-20130122/48921_1 /TAXON_ID=447022 ORGANISM="Scrippsiella hangoei-like, Strain SHHI-4" /NCGR_SAMPLE_ID=MMETSP0369 /ASSEMBLY_ACC=CAM_ASM_000364 /LENGTH=59 /DNA_ID=CAMNT_0019002337 /DNA_START=73 /DNA_END=249 /DNA_ORIENTATION=-
MHEVARQQPIFLDPNPALNGKRGAEQRTAPDIEHLAHGGIRAGVQREAVLEAAKEVLHV